MGFWIVPVLLEGGSCMRKYGIRNVYFFGKNSNSRIDRTKLYKTHHCVVLDWITNIEFLTLVMDYEGKRPYKIDGWERYGTMLQNNPYLYTKSYIPSITKTQKNLWIYGFFGRLGRHGGNEFFCNFAKVSYFWGWFMFISYFHGQNDYKIRISSLKI